MFDPDVAYWSYALNRYSLRDCVNAAIQQYVAKFAHYPPAVYIPAGGDVTVHDIVSWGADGLVVVRDERVKNRIAMEAHRE